MLISVLFHAKYYIPFSTCNNRIMSLSRWALKEVNILAYLILVGYSRRENKKGINNYLMPFEEKALYKSGIKWLSEEKYIIKLLYKN